MRLQVKAQWTVAQQGETGSVLQVDCLMVGEQEGNLQLTAKACPALPRLVQAMDSMQAHSTAVAVATLTYGVDAAKAVLRESEHPLPPPSACRLLIAVLLLTGWCILLPGPAARPCCQALHLCKAHSAVAVAALACGMDAAKAVLRKSEHLLPPSSACRLLVAALLDKWMVNSAARPCTSARQLQLVPHSEHGNCVLSKADLHFLKVFPRGPPGPSS